MHAIVGLRRWRRNPLRRTTDLVEAWAALATALLIAIAAPAAGVLGGALVDSSLRSAVRLQHAQRHPATAVVLGRAPGRHRWASDAESPVAGDIGDQVRAEWRAPDGAAHTGTLSAPGHDPRTGATFRVWTDDGGEVVAEPMTASAARIQAVLAAVVTTALVVALLECGRRLFVWRLVKRRYRRLDRDWAGVGPDWGRTAADS